MARCCAVSQGQPPQDILIMPYGSEPCQEGNEKRPRRFKRRGRWFRRLRVLQTGAGQITQDIHGRSTDVHSLVSMIEFPPSAQMADMA